MTNSNYSAEGNKVTDFEVGQEVVFFRSNGFNERYSMAEGWKVRKITKTRITFTREASHGTFDKVYVVDKFNEVRKEVGKESYHSDRVLPANHERVVSARQHNEAVKVRDEALVAMREGGKGRFLTVETAEEVIAALQAYIASTKS
jgi:hypothetical protein